MKKTVRVVSLIVVIALALLVLTGCSDTPAVGGTKADVQAQIAVANSLTDNQPTPKDISYSLERYNLIRRAYWVNGQREKADDATAYSTRKQVEDTCRAMMTSYTSDSLIYQQYKDSENAEKLSWAEQAKMRANKTAASYNEYVLKNSFVWNGNVPADIRTSLPYLD